MSCSLKLSQKSEKKTSKFLYEIENIALEDINKLLGAYVFWKLYVIFFLVSSVVLSIFYYPFQPVDYLKL